MNLKQWNIALMIKKSRCHSKNCFNRSSALDIFFKLFRGGTDIYDMEELLKNYSVNRKTAVSNYTYILFTLQYITHQNFHLTNFSIYN